jgi:uncharacterized membrane protein (UPF0127 family)
MKKVLIAYGILVIIVIVLAVAKFRGFDFLPSINAGKTATINSHTYNLLIANDDKSRQIGLSDRKSLDKNTGMLFIFPKKDIYSFWMKNTLIPLDMIFINDNNIVYIVKNAPPQAGKNGNLPIYTPKNEANYVLEINGGQADKYKFKVGDKVTLKGIK